MPTFQIASGTVQKDGPLLLRAAVKDYLLEDILSRIDSPHKFIFYHFPLSGVDPKKPGGGSCLFSYGECPVGHNDRPSWLFQFQGEGIPREIAGSWKVGDQSINLNILRGHQAGFAVVPSTPDAFSRLDPTIMSNLSSQIEELKKTLALVKRLKEGK